MKDARTGKGRPSSQPIFGDEESHPQRLRRLAVSALVTVNADSEPVEATTCDVSETGLKITIDAPLAIGPVTVKMVGLPIFSGEVRWRGGDQCGIELCRPIPDEYLATWIEAHGSLNSVTLAGRSGRS
jgi:hypothetical protein